MSVRDDYPAVAILVDACAENPKLREPEAVRMFHEIERLRNYIYKGPDEDER